MPKSSRADQRGSAPRVTTEAMLNLNQLRHFVAAVEAGSFRSAAQSLSVSQAAITKSIKALEGELGVSLLIRHSRGAMLTEHGSEFLRHARLIVAEVVVATERMRAVGDPQTGSVRIGTAAAASITMLPDVVTRLKRRWPQAEISVAGGLPIALMPRLMDGSLDLVIGPSQGVHVPKGISSEWLFDAVNVIVARKNHPLSQVRRLDELVDAEWILTDELCAHDSCINKAVTRAGLPSLNVRIKSDDPFLTDTMVSTSDCLSVIRKGFFKSNIMASHLIALDIEEVQLLDPICVFTRKAHEYSVIQKTFIEYLEIASKSFRSKAAGDARFLQSVVV